MHACACERVAHGDGWLMYTYYIANITDIAFYPQHGRQGKPHVRLIRVRGLLIDWGSGSIEFGAVQQIVSGKQCDVIRAAGDDVAPPALCFSVIAKDRSLALQAASPDERDRWVTGVHMCLRAQVCWCQCQHRHGLYPHPPRVSSSVGSNSMCFLP
jgi:hypothetical protein